MYPLGIFSPERRLWVGTLFLGCMVAYACRTVFPLTVPIMSKELGWSKSEAVSKGYLITAFEFTQYLFNCPIIANSIYLSNWCFNSPYD